MAKNVAASRITKKLLPQQPGAKTLAVQYGPALVCVRYRLDQTQGRRYTTVELLVDEGPARIHPKTLQPVYIRLANSEKVLWRAMLNEGAQWDKTHYAWRITYAAAKRLHIHHRALTECPPVDSNT